MSTCGDCQYGKFPENEHYDGECYGLPPTPTVTMWSQAHMSGDQWGAVQTDAVRPYVNRSDRACSLWRACTAPPGEDLRAGGGAAGA